MRVLQMSMTLDSPDIRDVDVAAQEHEIPVKGDRVSIEGEWYRVLEVSSWRERSSQFERDREVALALRVQRDDLEGNGVAELRPDGPHTLVAGAEAEPRMDDE